VNGAAISDDALLERVQEIMPLVRSHNAIFFEAATIMAFRHFAKENVDIAVIETGLGGRLDATNILSAKNVLLTAITSIDFDHTEFLGDTLPDIAGEKAGIMKQNVPCIIAEPRPELWLTFMEHSAQTQAPVCFLDDAYRVNVNRFNPDFSMNLALKAPKLTLEDIHVNLCGRHQARNILTAFALIQQGQKRFPVSIDGLRQGLVHIKENSGLRGRIEVLRPKDATTQPIVLDVAHNPAGVQMLVETLRACGYADSRWHVVFTAMQDKRIETMLETLVPITARLYAPHLDFPRARTNMDIADTARSLSIHAEAFDSVHAAYSAALANADAEHAPVLLAGSFHLAEEILAQEPS
jgi:dihydrofolate synthase/folylpolyglutamate synthase